MLSLALTALLTLVTLPQCGLLGVDVLVKDGVKVGRLDQRMCLAVLASDLIVRKQDRDLVITSGVDGLHKFNSRHYVGLAIDIRTRDLPYPRKAAEDIQKFLGVRYLVLLEKDHIHIALIVKEKRIWKELTTNTDSCILTK